MDTKIFQEVYYRLYCAINHVIPKKKNYIFFYDSKFQRQNCWALLQYLINNNVTGKYKLFYYTEADIGNAEVGFDNVIILNTFLKGWWYHLRSKYTFYEYANNKFVSTSALGQKNFNIWHGMPLKKIGYPAGEKPIHPYSRDFDYILATSKLYSDVMKKCFGCTEEQIYIGGYPRNDQLFSNKELYPFFEKDKRNILWMPTFRKSKTNHFDDSVVSFPLVNCEEINELDKWLGENNIRLLIKLHPFQDNVPWLTSNRFDNIEAIYNNSIFENGFELYDVVGQADILITDYSSVYIDYLLLSRPIIFTDDDIDQYKKKRGFLFDNIESYLPGPLVSNVGELCAAITEIIRFDSYAEQRMRVNEKFNSSKNEFSKALITFLGI